MADMYDDDEILSDAEKVAKKLPKGFLEQDDSAGNSGSKRSSHSGWRESRHFSREESEGTPQRTSRRAPSHSRGDNTFQIPDALIAESEAQKAQTEVEYTAEIPVTDELVDERQGAEPEGVQSQVVEPQGAEPEGVQSQGAEPQGAEPEGAQSQVVEPEGAEPEGDAASSEGDSDSPDLSYEWSAASWNSASSVEDTLTDIPGEVSSAPENVVSEPSTSSDGEDQASTVSEVTEEKNYSPENYSSAETYGDEEPFSRSFFDRETVHSAPVRNGLFPPKENDSQVEDFQDEDVTYSESTYSEAPYSETSYTQTADSQPSNAESPDSELSDAENSYAEPGYSVFSEVESPQVESTEVKAEEVDHSQPEPERPSENLHPQEASVESPVIPSWPSLRESSAQPQRVVSESQEAVSEQQQAVPQPQRVVSEAQQAISEPQHVAPQVHQSVSPQQPGVTQPALSSLAQDSFAPVQAPSVLSEDSAPEKKTKKSRRGLGFVGATSLALVAGLIGGAAGGFGIYKYLDQDDTTLTSVTSTGLTQQSGSSNKGGANSVEAVAAKVLPSVVSIDVYSQAATTGSFLDPFFGMEGFPEQQMSAEGSGSIISEDGAVLTNNHVVAGLGTDVSIDVTLHDGRVFPADVVATDPSSDIAVIKLRGVSGLTPIAFGDSNALQVGQPVVAVGSPLGLSATVTSGIVSALNRPISATGGDMTGQDQQAIINAVQTDAAINPGNSGGPLVDMNGALIGMNSVIASTGQSQETAGNIGLGFAIPSNYAKRTADQLLTKKQAVQPMLGVNILSSSDPRTVGIHGAPIAQVNPNTPGEAAGLQPGDVITKVNDTLIERSEDLIATIRSQDFGATVTLTVTDENGANERTVQVTLTGEDVTG